MKLSTYATISAIVALAYGIALLLFPVSFIEKYGVVLDPASTVITRFFGSAMFGFGILYWTNRNIPSSDKSWSGLLWSGVFLNVANCIITVMAITKGIGNSLGWSTVAVNVIFALGSLYFISTRNKVTA